MRRHYLKIPNSIQSWYPGGAPGDWRSRIFDDATERGTRLTLCSAGFLRRRKYTRQLNRRVTSPVTLRHYDRALNEVTGFQHAML